MVPGMCAVFFLGLRARPWLLNLLRYHLFLFNFVLPYLTQLYVIVVRIIPNKVIIALSCQAIEQSK